MSLTVKFVGFPNGEEVIVTINEEQLGLLKYLEERGALAPNFKFEEIIIESLC